MANTNEAGYWKDAADTVDAGNTLGANENIAGYLARIAEKTAPGNPSGFERDEIGYLAQIATGVDPTNTGGYAASYTGYLARIAEKANPGGAGNSVPAFLARIAAGAANLTTYATPAFLMADDFKRGEYYQGGTCYASAPAIPGYAYSRSGAIMEPSAAGNALLPFAANVSAIIPGKGCASRAAVTNLFLNSATGATQSVTLTAAAHTLTFNGTGSITLSGAASGSLAGTGANNRVSLAFTPTAGSVTFTVTGSVSNVQLNLGANADRYVATAGATATAGADSLIHDMPALVDQDMLIWATGKPDEVPATSGALQYFLYISDGTVENRLGLYIHPTLFRVFGLATAGGTTQSPNVPFTPVAGQQITAIYHRVGGQYRCGVYNGSTITWSTFQTLALGTGMTKAFLNYSSGQNIRGILGGAFIKAGTFATDADVIAAITPTL